MLTIVDTSGETEARRAIAPTVRRAVGAPLTKPVLDLIERAYGDAGFPVMDAAAEAIAERAATAAREKLRVADRPSGPAVYGVYRTRRARCGRRPYETALTSLDPIRGSCGCPDFRKSSLGLCKHLLAVLATIVHRRSALPPSPPVKVPSVDQLELDPIVPCDSDGDRLAQVRLVPGKQASQVRGLFDATGRLRETHRNDRLRRRRVLRALGSIALTDPALREVLTQERARCEPRGITARTVDRCLATLHMPIFPHQREAVYRFCGSGRLLLADDMGLGKTVQAIAAAHVLITSRRARRVLVFVPASLKAQWLAEWSRFSPTPVCVVEGRPEERQAIYRSFDRGALLVNFEQALHDLEEMRRFAPDLVILDEAQRIKNWETKTARAIKALDAPFRLAMTGTPLENRLDELGSIVDWLEEAALGPAWRIAPLHTNGRTTLCDPEGHDPEAGTQLRLVAEKLDVIRRRTSHLLLRRTRHEVLPDLPNRTDHHVQVELTLEQKLCHDELSPAIASIARRGRRRRLTRSELMRLLALLTQQRVIANGLAQSRFESTWPTLARARPTHVAEQTGSNKLAAFRRLVQEIVIERNEKMVVFSEWRRMLKLAEWATADLLADHGLRAAFFTGRESLGQRRTNVVDFHDDPLVSVLFCSDAGAVGLNLQRAARVCVNLELPWNPAILEQRIARIHRLGQPERVEVYHLSTAESVEARIDSGLSAKRALFDELLDGDGDAAFCEAGERGMMAVASSYLAPCEPAGTPGGASCPTAVNERESVRGTGRARRDRGLWQAPAESIDAHPFDEWADVDDDVSAFGDDADAELPPEMVRLVRDMRLERDADGSFSLPAAPDPWRLAQVVRELDLLWDRRFLDEE